MGAAPVARDFRLLVTGACDGPTNMAIDEALWRGRCRGTAPATLRFFAWEPPTVSLGYGQALDAYSVVASNPDLGIGRDLLASYRWIAAALVRGLRALGAEAEMIAAPRHAGAAPAFCFARTGRYEIEIDGRKIVGSAQRRQGQTFLQHGSVLLGVDADRLRALFPTTADPLAPLTTLEAALGHRPKFDDVVAALVEAFEAEHGLTLRPGGLSAEEAALADRLVAEKYATAAWLDGVPEPRRPASRPGTHASGV
ncbi:MAG: lipoate--protein ligase family protein [Candidatus Rokubacteria bacterium]|nr:lipoate--protein ligase family protein [Candidatus Rokubacteria bacterium]